LGVNLRNNKTDDCNERLTKSCKREKETGKKNHQKGAQSRAGLGSAMKKNCWQFEWRWGVHRLEKGWKDRNVACGRQAEHYNRFFWHAGLRKAGFFQLVE